MDAWIPVIGDAVKIGLGALIGGFFAWLLARHNAKSAIEDLRLEIAELKELLSGQTA